MKNSLIELLEAKIKELDKLIYEHSKLNEVNSTWMKSNNSINRLLGQIDMIKMFINKEDKYVYMIKGQQIIN